MIKSEVLDQNRSLLLLLQKHQHLDLLTLLTQAVVLKSSLTLSKKLLVSP